MTSDLTNIHISALIITGGLNGSRLQSVEVYRQAYKTTCSLPSLPTTADHHTQDGLRQCGGEYGSEQSCHQFINGQWTKSHSLSEERKAHSSWKTQEGELVLLGGGRSKTSTEILTDSGGVSPGFPLKYETM